jgi:hypothetical protein
MGPWQYRLRALGRGKTLGAGWKVREEMGDVRRDEV